MEYFFNTHSKKWNLNDFTSYVLSKEIIQNVDILLRKLSAALKYFISSECVASKVKEQADKLIQDWNVSRKLIFFYIS